VIRLDRLGQPWSGGERHWTSKDALLYAVAVGAGTGRSDELDLVTENSANISQRVLPTFAAVILGVGEVDELGDFARAKVLHADQSLTLHQAIPPEGVATSETEIVEVLDKAPNALIRLRSTLRLGPDGAPLANLTSTLFVRGEGGFGGIRVKSDVRPAPGSPPDRTVEVSTAAHQALLYRLTGDRNPLHSDPVVARKAGYERPILHGLCTWAIAGLTLTRTFDARRECESLSARFAGPVYPGEILSFRIWRQSDCLATFEAYVGDRLVLAQGAFTARAPVEPSAP
jgi:acyl dehydratase